MKLLKTIKHEYFEIFPPTAFFFIAFNLILVTKILMLREYGISWTGFGGAIVGAMLVGKVVLIADKLHFVNRLTHRPLIYNTLWKSLIYFLAAVLVQYFDRIASLLTKHQTIMEANRRFVDEIAGPHFWLIQMWLAVLFFAYCALRELIRVIGRDKVVHMFFGGRGDAVKGETIGAVVDDRTAGYTERFSKWGSAEEAFKFWAERIVKFIDGTRGMK
jgi:hypothetical protein